MPVIVPTTIAVPGGSGSIVSLNQGNQVMATSHCFSISPDQPPVPARGCTWRVPATPNVTAGSYVANAAYGGIMTFANILQLAGWQSAWMGELNSLFLKFKGSVQNQNFWVMLWTTPPGTPANYSDHAVPTWNPADAQYLFNVYPLVGATTPGNFAMSTYSLTGIGDIISGQSTSLSAAVIGQGASSNNLASVSDMTLELGILL